MMTGRVMADPPAELRSAITLEKATVILARVGGSADALAELRQIALSHAQRSGISGDVEYYLSRIEEELDKPPAMGVTVSLTVDLDGAAAARLWLDIDRSFSGYLDGLPVEQALELNLLIGFRVVTRGNTVV